MRFAEVRPIRNVGSAIIGSVRDQEERDAILLYTMIICLASFEATFQMHSEAKKDWKPPTANEKRRNAKWIDYIRQSMEKE